MSLRVLNPNAEVLNKSAALHMNINAAKGLQDVLKTNLGPKGTIKMLVGGAGDIKLTKDGNTLLKEMVPFFPFFFLSAIFYSDFISFTRFKFFLILVKTR